jgi:guanylate kinase
VSNPNEVAGQEYHFVDEARFREMVADGAFAEWAHVHGNLYGTSVTEIDRARASGKRGVLFDVDYQWNRTAGGLGIFRFTVRNRTRRRGGWLL